MLDLAIPAVNEAIWGEEGWQYTPRLCAEVGFFHLKSFLSQRTCPRLTDVQ